MICDSGTDFMYPLTMEIYYPIVETGAYGNLKREWVLDRVVACYFNPAGRKFKEDILPDANITIDNSVVGRVREDITQSNKSDSYSMTNIIITNIKDRYGNVVYNESSGVRKGLATIWEVATLNPIIGAFGDIDYYKLVIRRSDDQSMSI